MVNILSVQLGPDFLDPEATTNKICRYIEKASKYDPEIIVFPELILSGYPNFIPNLENRKKYHLAAIKADGPEIEQISKKAEEIGSVIVLGFIERDPEFIEVIYDSSCVIDNDGRLIGTHRKISAIGVEKVIFKEGDAKDIRIFETAVCKLGIGLCFENLNPLYRRALHLLGEEIHCALWVTSEDNKHVIDASAKMTAIEGGLHVILSSQVSPKTRPRSGLSIIGGSGIIDPWGTYISGPIFKREKILSANIDPESWNIQKLQSRGIDARDDLLSLNLAKNEYRGLNIKNQEIKNI